MPPDELRLCRRAEAAAAGEHIGAEYVTWDFRDGYLQADLETREAIIREIRTFAPDLVLTHRPCDYHPDHRAVGQAVQDASYLVTVPHVASDVPALRQDPVVAYMCDLFTRPNRLRADVVLDTSIEFGTAIGMAACHKSQFFDWLAYHDGVLETVPSSDRERHDWLAGRFQEWHQQRRAHFSTELEQVGIQVEDGPPIEVYEISEYAADLQPAQRMRLFPGGLSESA